MTMIAIYLRSVNGQTAVMVDEFDCDQQRVLQRVQVAVFTTAAEAHHLRDALARDTTRARVYLTH